MIDSADEFVQRALRRVVDGVGMGYHFQRFNKKRGREDWLPFPEGFSEKFTGNDYGEKAGPTANFNTLMGEELDVEVFRTFMFTTSGGDFAFNPHNQATVRALVDMEETLAVSPVLDDDELYAVEQVLWREAFDDYLLDDIMQLVGQAVGVDVDDYDYNEDEAMIELVWMWVCTNCFGYYSADDIGINKAEIPELASHFKSVVLVDGNILGNNIDIMLDRLKYSTAPNATVVPTIQIINELEYLLASAEEYTLALVDST